MTRIDLNLLITLDVLFDERSVTRAAARLSLSQPATSAALSRLRTYFNDKLLVRSRGEMLLTERANALRQPIKEALRTVAQALGTQNSFHAKAFDGRFRLALLDVTNFNLGADIVSYLRAYAPLASAEFIALDRQQLSNWLRHDAIDAAIAVYGADEGSHESEHLFDDEMVFVASTSHPVLRKRPQPFARVSKYPLIEVSAATSMMRPFFERQASLGHKWRTMMIVPYFTLVPSMVESTDCIGVMGRVAAEKFQRMGRVTIVDISETTPSFQYKIIWHKRRTHDPMHVWMRTMIQSITRQRRPSSRTTKAARRRPLRERAGTDLVK